MEKLSKKGLNEQYENREIIGASISLHGAEIMDGTLRKNIIIGSKVSVVQKQDQGTGRLTEGIVAKILTNSQVHPHGIKVMLENNVVGRVKEVDVGV